MRLDKVVLDNFLTYNHIEYDIPRRPLLIQGLNLTDEGQESNGSGKSGILTGIEFCITASNSRDVRDIELVQYGQQEARAQLIASCDVRKESIHIDWTIKAKGSNKLTLLKKVGTGDWEEISFSNVNDGKKFIIAWFAISKEDLFSYYIINKTRFKSFFKTSQKEKVDLINRFSDASIVSNLEDIDNSELNEELETLNSESSKLEGKIELVKSQILKEENRDFKAEFDEEISDIDEEIESIRESIETSKANITSHKDSKKNLIKDITKEGEAIRSAQRKITPIQKDYEAEETRVKEVNKELDGAQKLVDDFINTNWNEKRESFEEDIEEREEGIETIEEREVKEKEQETKILKFLQGIEVKLEGAITCPNCSTEFTLDGDIDTLKEKESQGRKLLKTVVEKLELSGEEISDAKEKIAEIEKSVSAINKEEQTEIQEKNKLSQAVFLVKDRINSHEARMAELKASISTLEEEISSSEQELINIDNRDKGFDIKIKSEKSTIEGYKTEIKNYEVEKSNLKQGDSKIAIKDFKTEQSILEADFKAKVNSRSWRQDLFEKSVGNKL